MKVAKVMWATGLAVVAAGVAGADVRETFSFSGLVSDGDSAASSQAGKTTFSAVGGYSLGRIDVTGTLRSFGIGSYGSESRVQVARPGGGFVELQPFPSAGDIFSTLTWTGSFFTGVGSNPAGGWNVATFESFDDGGVSDDAIWDSLTFNFTDEAPVAPMASDLGTLVSGATSASGTLSTTDRVKWYKFTTGGDAAAGIGTFLDVDTEGSALVGVNNDTEIGLYSSSGALIGADDDDGSGLLSQLTFGSGTRPAAPPTGGGSLGEVYDGRDGMLPAGTYYLAIGSFNTVFSEGFLVTAGTDNTGTFKININTTAVPAPGTLALVAVGGLVTRRRRA